MASRQKSSHFYSQTRSCSLFPKVDVLPNGYAHFTPPANNFRDPSLIDQKIQVSLSAPSPASVDMALPGAGLSALPSTHLTPKTLVGVGGEGRETLGHLYASQIASHLTLRDPNEKRTLLLGLGFDKVENSGEAFYDLLGLVLQVL